MTKLTAKEMREMVGCSVSYRGCQGTIQSVRPDMERVGMPSLCIRFEGGGVAILRPSELANMSPAVDPRITIGSAVAVDGVDFVAHVGGRELRVTHDGGRFVMTGGQWGEHSIASDFAITNASRLLAHWRGYVENNECAVRAAS